jgi:hypothetical protein
MNLDKILSNVKDYHLPICVGVFGIGTTLQWFHHLDMAFVAFTGTVLGADHRTCVLAGPHRSQTQHCKRPERTRRKDKK